MARGMVNGEAIVSQAQTRAFDDGWDRMKHENDGRRGRFVWDEKAKRLVPAAEYHAARAVDAPIMVDRFYEGAVATDGTDIGSRRKRNEYMRRAGVADASDYSPGWYENRRKDMKRDADRQRRETLERALFQQRKP